MEHGPAGSRAARAAGGAAGRRGCDRETHRRVSRIAAPALAARAAAAGIKRTVRGSVLGSLTLRLVIGKLPTMACLKPATRLALFVLMTAAGAHAEEPHALPVGDATRGQGLYQACSGCHSIDENDVGPKHRGVLGRRAGSLPDYAYSQALRNSQITWDAANLDRWLTSPQALVPGTKMFFSLPDAQMRADIIAYLAQLK